MLKKHTEGLLTSSSLRVLKRSCSRKSAQDGVLKRGCSRGVAQKRVLKAVMLKHYEEYSLSSLSKKRYWEPKLQDNRN